MYFINGTIGNIINFFDTYHQIAFQKRYNSLYPIAGMLEFLGLFFPPNTVCYYLNKFTNLGTEKYLIF